MGGGQESQKGQKGERVSNYIEYSVPIELSQAHLQSEWTLGERDGRGEEGGKVFPWAVVRFKYRS